MFTLGHKALILNKLRPGDVVTANGGDATASVFKIQGFCDFQATTVKTIVVEDYSAGTNSEADFTAIVPAGIAVGDSIEVEVRFVQNRYVSEYTSDFIKPGDTIIFQTQRFTAVPTADDGAAAIIQGWKDYQARFNLVFDYPIDVVVAPAPDAVHVTATKNFLIIESVNIKNVPGGAKTIPAQQLPLAPTNVVGSDEGVGVGKFVEESIRTASYTNMDPYANKPHGSDSVDVRGQYWMVEFTGKNEELDGWAPHEHLGTAVADQNVQHGDQKYTLYLNKDFAWGNIAGTNP